MKNLGKKNENLEKSSVGRHVGFSPEKRPHPFRGKKHPEFFKLFKNNFILVFFFFILKLFFEKFEKFRMFFPQRRGLSALSSSSAPAQLSAQLSALSSQLSALSSQLQLRAFLFAFLLWLPHRRKNFFENHFLPRIHTNLSFQTFSNFS